MRMPWFCTSLGMLGSRCNLKRISIKVGRGGGGGRDNWVEVELNRVGRGGKRKIAGEEVRVRGTMVMRQIIIMCMK